MSAERTQAQVQRFLQQGRPELAFDLLTGILLSGEAELATIWAAYSLIGQVIERFPSMAATEARQAAAQRCGLQLPVPRDASGRAEFPTIAGDHRRFLIVHVHNGRGQDQIHPEHIRTETRNAVEQALAAARAIASDHRPLCVSFDLEQGIVAGRSCGLAVGVAALSFLCRVNLSPRFLFTGFLRSDGLIESVDLVPEKLQLRRESRPLATLIVPDGKEGQDTNAYPARSLEEIWRSRMILLHHDPAAADHGYLNLDLELGGIRDLFSAGRWVDAERKARLIIEHEGLHAEEELTLRTILLAAANHRGEQQQAASLTRSIQRMLHDDSLPVQAVAIAMANVAVHTIDLLRPVEAAQVLEQAERLPLPPKDLAWVHLRGTRARACILAGDLHGALAHRQQNAALCPGDEVPRCLGDLADIYMRSGDFDLAQEALDRARDAIGRLQRGWRRLEYLNQTRRYLDLYTARLHRLRGDRDNAKKLLQALHTTSLGPSLELRIESALLEESLPQRLAEIEAAFAAVPEREQVIYRALYLRARCLAGDDSAHVELARLFNLETLSVSELAVRLPY